MGTGTRQALTRNGIWENVIACETDATSQVLNNMSTKLSPQGNQQKGSAEAFWKHNFPPSSHQGCKRLVDSLWPQNVLYSLFSGFSVVGQKGFPFGTTSFSNEHAHAPVPSSSHCWLPWFLWKEGALIDDLGISSDRWTFAGSRWWALTGRWLSVAPGAPRANLCHTDVFHQKPVRLGHPGVPAGRLHSVWALSGQKCSQTQDS